MKTQFTCLLALLLASVGTAQSPISLVSRISPSESSIMTISRNDQNGVIVTTSVQEAKKDDQTRIYIYGPSYSNGIIHIPSDGKTYWVINFNPSVQDPVKLISFGEITADCHCPSTGCQTEVCTQAYEEDGIIVCPPGSCLTGIQIYNVDRVICQMQL